ncbi:MAG: PASTA domain-containing protein, partial [Sedimentisphaerales bacterium]|nr:PASTA domain-containing protein [Sedimentisphaerales bacterium]
ESSVGGLVGVCGSGGILDNSYALCSVSGINPVGGLVGSVSGNIQNCYSAGKIFGSGGYIGGVIGYSSGSISGCFWDTEVSGLSNGVGSGSASGIAGKTTIQMQTQSTFTSAGWDFSDTDGDAADWQMVAGSYPLLAWEDIVFVTVPDLSGLTLEQAQGQLTALGLGCIVNYSYSDVASGLVCDQSPVAGLSVYSFRSVTITVSLGALFSGGSGTESDPYQIATAEDLILMGQKVSQYDKCFVLTNNIDLSGYEFDSSIISPRLVTVHIMSDDLSDRWLEYSVDEFLGKFDGNGKVIFNYNITCHGSYYTSWWSSSLFGVIGDTGRVINLGVENATVSSYVDTGGTICTENYGLISGCYSTGNVISDETIGGLCGINGGTIDFSYSTCSVNGGYSLVGGLVGINYGSIYSSYATGSIAGGHYVGGLVGENKGAITRSYATGSFKSAGWYPSYVGGLVGCNDGNINTSYATGSVITNDSIHVGGLAGENRGAITTCFSTGSVSGSTNVGGFIGNCTSLVPSSGCFWDKQASGKANGVGSGSATGITGKTTSEMKTLSTFTAAGWDFSTTDGDAADWCMYVNNYPRLAWEKVLACTGETTFRLPQDDQPYAFDLEIFNSAEELISWNLSGFADCPWIASVTPVSGSSSGPNDKTTVTVVIDQSQMPVGDYSCQLELAENSGLIQTIPISVHIYQPVGLEELEVLADNWLESRSLGDPNNLIIAPNYYIDSVIDLRDFAQLAKSWQQENMTYGRSAIIESFETGDLSALPWTFSGDSNWVIDPNSFDGTSSIRSGVIGDNQSSAVSVTLNCKLFTTVNFACSVSSQSRGDCLNFKIDGVTKLSRSGTFNWAEHSFPISEGVHTFTWEYRKNASVSSGQDCARIDKLVIQ